MPQDEDGQNVADLVEQPAKVMRIGSMIKQLLDEVKSAPLDEAARQRLKQIHATSIKELEDGLAPELIEELDRLSLPFTDDSVPSEAELRIAQAQLVGWLEGLFHGIQTALFAQQMAAPRAVGADATPSDRGLRGEPRADAPTAERTVPVTQPSLLDWPNAHRDPRPGHRSQRLHRRSAGRDPRLRSRRTGHRTGPYLPRTGPGRKSNTNSATCWMLIDSLNCCPGTGGVPCGGVASTSR